MHVLRCPKGFSLPRSPHSRQPLPAVLYHEAKMLARNGIFAKPSIYAVRASVQRRSRKTCLARLLRIYYTIFPRGKQEIFSLFPRLSVFSVTFLTLVPLRVSDFTHVVPLLSSAEHILDYTRFRAEGDAPLALRSFCRNSSYRLQ